MTDEEIQLALAAHIAECLMQAKYEFQGAAIRHVVQLAERAAADAERQRWKAALRAAEDPESGMCAPWKICEAVGLNWAQLD